MLFTEKLRPDVDVLELALLKEKKIRIEKEIKFGKSKSIYFRDPVGNMVEFITSNAWPVDD